MLDFQNDIVSARRLAQPDSPTIDNCPEARATLYWAPKNGNSDSEYEDAACCLSFMDTEATLLRVAVADGATETSFAANWANALVTAYCRGYLSEAEREKTLQRLSSDWLAEISSRSLPWFAEDKANNGASATLCGLTIRIPDKASRDPVRWQASAIGDSCLFHIRNTKLLQSFPLNSSAQFDNTPPMLCSVASNFALPPYNTLDGIAMAGDLFLLMTDSIAQHYLRTQEQNGSAEFFLQALACQQTFQDYISRMRSTAGKHSEKRLRNDDVTIIKIELA